jgi:hypothetical protein
MFVAFEFVEPETPYPEAEAPLTPLAVLETPRRPGPEVDCPSTPVAPWVAVPRRPAPEDTFVFEPFTPAPTPALIKVLHADELLQ